MSQHLSTPGDWGHKPYGEGTSKVECHGMRFVGDGEGGVMVVEAGGAKFGTAEFDGGYFRGCTAERDDGCTLVTCSAKIKAKIRAIYGKDKSPLVVKACLYEGGGSFDDEDD